MNLISTLFFHVSIPFISNRKSNSYTVDMITRSFKLLCQKSFLSDEVFRHPTKAGKVHQNFFGLFWFFYFRCGLHIAKIRFLEDQQRRGMTHYVTVRRKKSQK